MPDRGLTNHDGDCDLAETSTRLTDYSAMYIPRPRSAMSIYIAQRREVFYKQWYPKFMPSKLKYITGVPFLRAELRAGFRSFLELQCYVVLFVNLC